jgi:pimeloyl-ACP methyl ester carboxylesterase
MTEETVAYLNTLGLERVDVIGHSDGAIIGILLARDYPGYVRSLTAISANLNASGYVSDEDAELAFSEHDIAALQADYDRLSPDGPAHRPELWERINLMWDTQPDIPSASLAAITCPALVMAADHDVVSLPHTIAIRDAIPDARLSIIPGATHMLLAQRPSEVGTALLNFLAERP